MIIPDSLKNYIIKLYKTKHEMDSLKIYTRELNEAIFVEMKERNLSKVSIVIDNKIITIFNLGLQDSNKQNLIESELIK